MTEVRLTAPIESYALIGNCYTAALVGLDGSIDWLCLPDFGSAACFAALLGTPDNGRWQIAPVGPHTAARRYRGDTMVLETMFTTPDGGSAVVVDFMPRGRGGGAVDLVRIVRPIKGTVTLRTDGRVSVRLRPRQAVGAAARRRRRPRHGRPRRGRAADNRAVAGRRVPHRRRGDRVCRRVGRGRSCCRTSRPTSRCRCRWTWRVPRPRPSGSGPTGPAGTPGRTGTGWRWCGRC